MSRGMPEGLWTEIEPSQFAHEREALDFVRRRLPNNEPWRAWSNFTFVDANGRPSEVDLLVVAPSGIYLIEIKSYPDGKLEADAGTWRWHKKDGGVRNYDSPFIAADGKAKRLKSLLLTQKALRPNAAPPMARDLWVQALVFVSSPHLRVELDPRLNDVVFGPDVDGDATQANQLDGLIAKLKHLDAHRGARVDRPASAAIAKAMEQAAIRKSEKYRKAGSYKLVELLDEGETWQDYRATHSALKVDKRVRLHLQHRAATDDERDALQRAAAREFQLLQGIRHPGIESPDSLEPNPVGPATIYPYDPDAVRLDHWLEQHPDIDLLTRLELFRAIAETVAHAHEKGLAHRSLSPRHVWIRDPDGTPTPVVRDWTTISRELGTTASTSQLANPAHGTRHAGHLAMLAGEEAGPYLAPELRTVPGASGRLVDVFALGCLLHLIVTGQPAATDSDTLQQKLDEHGHVPLAAAMDAAPSELADLVREATAADATDRLPSVTDLLAFLDLAIDELTAPDEPDLLKASRGTSIDGWTLLGRLGAGASSVVYLAERNGTREVLKVSRDADHAQRLRDEHDVLARLHHPAVISTYGVEELAGHTVLRLEPGKTKRHGDAEVADTLAQRLRTEGPPTADLLQRWGADLLDAVVAMEREGVDHRDLKPENLVFVERGKYKETRLAVIDFSLAKASKQDLDAGTIGYIDPFLRDRPQRTWDLDAERYAAAVILTELATGDRPSWGDGVDPRATDREVPILRLAGVDAAIVDRLKELLERALHRDPTKRFDTADDLRRAWERVFTGIDESTGHAAGVSAEELDLSDLTAATPVVELGLAPRLVGAIERLGAATLGDLARAGGELSRLSGVGAGVRSEVRHLIRRLRDHGFGEEPESIDDLDPSDIVRLSVDRLSDRLVPTTGLSADVRTLLWVLLGLDIRAMQDWPTTSATAEALDVDSRQVTVELEKARRRWAERRPELVAVREEIAAWLANREGVATGEEVADLLLARRGSTQEEPLRSRRARAVVRACVEAEAAIGSPRFRAIRIGDRLLVALDKPAEVEGRGTISWNADPLVEAAAALGERADELVAEQDVVTPTAAITALRDVDLPTLPDAVAFDDIRLVRLAAAASTSAAVSSRGELYQRDLQPARAAAAARLALLDRHGLSPDQVHDRVRARFPRAAALPERPELDELLSDDAVGLAWDPQVRRYRLPDNVGAPSLTAASTATGTSYSTKSGADVEVDELERMLARLGDEGGFVAATVDPRNLDRAAERLAERLDAQLLDLDAVLIAAMRRTATDAKADWDVVVAADAAPPTDRAFRALEGLVRRALPTLDEQVRRAGKTVVATGAGLLARYGATHLLEQWREDLTRADSTTIGGSLRAFVLVVPGTDRDEKPTIDGTAIPVVTVGQWARIPTAWLERVPT